MKPAMRQAMTSAGTHMVWLVARVGMICTEFGVLLLPLVQVRCVGYIADEKNRRPNCWERQSGRGDHRGVTGMTPFLVVPD